MKKINLIYNLTIVIFAFIFFLPKIGTGQGTYRLNEKWSINLNLGYNNFYGDLKDKKVGFIQSTPFHKYFYENRKMMYGFMLSKDLSDVFSIRGQLLFGKLRSSKVSENTYFTANLYEYNINTKINLSNIIFGKYNYRKYTLYASIGIGLIDWNNRRMTIDSGIPISGNGFAKNVESGYRRNTTEGIIPIGLGLDYRINDKLLLSIETTLRGINTDQLDSYIDKAKKIEGFGYTSIALIYNFDFDAVHLGLSSPKYNGKSSDPSIKRYNKKRHIVMSTPQYKRSVKKRYRRYKGYKKSPFNLFKKRRVKLVK